MEYGALILMAVILVVLFIIGIWVSRFRTDRAVKRVIEIFREKGALDSENAMSRKELGLLSPAEQGLWERSIKPRDYKVYAFDVLIKLEVICSTEDEKYYLSEQALQASSLGDEF